VLEIKIGKLGNPVSFYLFINMEKNVFQKNVFTKIKKGFVRFSM